MAAVAAGDLHRTKTLAADGEVVWSWRRDPGVYPARPCGFDNGDNKGRSPGRARISRKTTRAGKAGMSRLYLSNPCALLLPVQHTVLRVHPAPGFPCAL